MNNYKVNISVVTTKVKIMEYWSTPLLWLFLIINTSSCRYKHYSDSCGNHFHAFLCNIITSQFIAKQNNSLFLIFIYINARVFLLIFLLMGCGGFKKSPRR